MQGISLTLGFIMLFGINITISGYFYRKKNDILLEKRDMDEDNFMLKYENKLKVLNQSAIGFFCLSLLFLLLFIIENFS